MLAFNLAMFSAPETDTGGPNGGRSPTFPALLRHHPQRHGGEACESAAKATRVEDGHLSRHQSSAMGGHGYGSSGIGDGR
jgi:hypothetical protein